MQKSILLSLQQEETSRVQDFALLQKELYKQSETQRSEVEQLKVGEVIR